MTHKENAEFWLKQRAHCGESQIIELNMAMAVYLMVCLAPSHEGY
jgi:hypothetical protein